MMDEHVANLAQRVQPQVMGISQSPVQPLGIRAAVREHGDDEVSVRADDPMQLGEGCRVVRNVLENTAADDGIELIVLVRQAVGVRQSGVTQAGKVEESAKVQI